MDIAPLFWKKWPILKKNKYDQFKKHSFRSQKWAQKWEILEIWSEWPIFVPNFGKVRKNYICKLIIVSLYSIQTIKYFPDISWIPTCSLGRVWDWNRPLWAGLGVKFSISRVILCKKKCLCENLGEIGWIFLLIFSHLYILASKLTTTRSENRIGKKFVKSDTP